MKKREKKNPMTETSLTHTTLHIPPTDKRKKKNPSSPSSNPHNVPQNLETSKSEPTHHHHHRITSLPKIPLPKIPKSQPPETKKVNTRLFPSFPCLASSLQMKGANSSFVDGGMNEMSEDQNG